MLTFLKRDHANTVVVVINFECKCAVLIATNEISYEGILQPSQTSRMTSFNKETT